MRFLYRPSQGRMIGGVGLALAERYDVDVRFVRLVLLALINTSELGILLYILLWLSIPSDRSVVLGLRLGESHELSVGERFDQFVHRGLASFGLSPYSLRSPIPAGIFLVTLSVFIFSLRLSGGIFRDLDALLGVRLGSALFYLALMALFFSGHNAPALRLRYLVRPRSRLDVERGPGKELSGFLAGIGATLKIDPAFLRVLAIVLNVLTLGGFGFVYIIASYILGRRSAILSGSSEVHDQASDSAVGSTMGGGLLGRQTSIMIGVLFGMLAVVRLVTEYRLFFFNEGFVTGIVLIVIGGTFALSAIRRSLAEENARALLLVGTVVFLYGCYELTAVLFGVQLSFAERFQLAFSVGALTALYFSLVAVEGSGRRIGLSTALLFVIPVLAIEWGMLSSTYLLAIVRFYSFFYPLLFAVAGLWLLFVGGSMGRESLTKKLLALVGVSARQTTNPQDLPQPQ